MGKLDKAKETINQFRVWLGILVLTDIGLVEWLASNIDNKNAVIRIALASLAVFVLSGLVVFVEKRIRTIIEELEEL